VGLDKATTTTFSQKLLF